MLQRREGVPINFFQTRFLTGSPYYKDLPADDLPEIAIAGRSNAGKSSLINNLCNQSKLARASSSPGKTREINLFGLYEAGSGQLQGRLADLPGYGYAKASHTLQESWKKELNQYLASRSCLKAVVVVMDSRHLFTALDEAAIGLAARRALRILLVFNKIDKLNQSQKIAARKLAQSALYNVPNSAVFFYSSLKNQGRDELSLAIAAVLEQSCPLEAEEPL